MDAIETFTNPGNPDLLVSAEPADNLLYGGEGHGFYAVAAQPPYPLIIDVPLVICQPQGGLTWMEPGCPGSLLPEQGKLWSVAWGHLLFPHFSHAINLVIRRNGFPSSSDRFFKQL